MLLFPKLSLRFQLVLGNQKQPSHTLKANIANSVEGSGAISSDDAEKFTSEMHDPCARGRCLQERTTQNHLQGGTGVEPAKHPPKVKSEMFLQL